MPKKTDPGKNARRSRRKDFYKTPREVVGELGKDEAGPQGLRWPS